MQERIGDPQRKKQCSKCQALLPLNEFHTNKKSRDGLQYACKKCNKEQFSKWYSPERHYKWRLRNKYGISYNQYSQMLEEQEGMCKVCGRPETHISSATGRVQPLSVDHDHKTGDVRALLCNNCNNALGYLHEDLERARALLAYIEWCQSREPNRKIIQLPLFEEESQR